ncbi:hypothetical protein PCS_03310 [Desulfocurvibacter africanus PCS]|uniref:Bacterial nucleoid DNA-binding protein n=1 Tax=Desulfocurvibacter africanus PCS TaxID=1262666 RepID=M5PNR3_DESAF|nr:hypothetical protein [Desulfocurvibacter africanus]EMG35827.1 hypothetical protein PCS_03310 [Desulfocurvibacter africanus PCS]
MIDKHTYVNELMLELPNLFSDPKKAEQAVDIIFGLIKDKVGNELVEIAGIGEFRTEQGRVVFTPTRSLMDRISESSSH